MTGAALGASTKRAPDFFIIGHERCGTTALYHMLRRHPQIFMPDFKEPRFFAPDLRIRAPEQAEGVHPRTLDSYLSLFASASPEQRVGEASPQYIWSRTAASGIADVQPAARIIAILREPVSFLLSLHLLRVKSNLETQRDLQKAMALEEDRRQGRHIRRGAVTPAWLMYSDYVRYVEQLSRYRAVFPPGQMLVLIYDDFRRDNEATVRKVLRFLDVDDTAAIEVIEGGEERRKAVRFLYLHRFTRALQAARRRPEAANSALRAMSSLAPRQLLPIWRRVIHTTQPPLAEQFALELRHRFKPEVVAISDYLGRDLVTQWGYDRID